MIWSKKQKPEMDAFTRLVKKIDKLYSQNPYVGKLSIGIYLAELQAITCSSIMGFYPSFKALLNREISDFYFKGVRLYIASTPNIKNMLLGENMFVDITNQEKWKKEGE